MQIVDATSFIENVLSSDERDDGTYIVLACLHSTMLVCARDDVISSLVSFIAVLWQPSGA